MSDNQNGSPVPGICAAFAVGALIGAGIAILFAPRSGKETREMVSRKACDLKDAADDAIRNGKQLVGEAKQKAGELYEKGKDAVKEARDSVTRSA
jgi:gas vesicle protein